MKHLIRIKNEDSFIIERMDAGRVMISPRPNVDTALFWLKEPDGLLVSDELEILFEIGKRKNPEPQSLFRYFFLDNLSCGTDTPYADIYMLPAGKRLILHQDGYLVDELPSVRGRWKPHGDRENIIRSFGDTLNSCWEEVFRDMARVDLAFSGGIDSGLIMGWARRQGLEVRAHTIEFKTALPTKKRDYEMAKARALHFGAEHIAHPFSPSDLVESVLKKWPSTPLLFNFNNINTYIIALLAGGDRGQVCTGDGTEEQYSAYAYHTPAYFMDRIRDSFSGDSEFNYEKGIIKNYGRSFFGRSWQWTGDLNKQKDLVKKIAGPSMKDRWAAFDADAYYLKALAGAPRSPFRIDGPEDQSFLNQVLWLDYNYNLTPKLQALKEILKKEDKIDVVLPFCHPSLVEAAEILPAELKILPRTSYNKYILRRIASDFLGEDEVFTSFKSGSDIPFDEWLLDPLLEEYVRSELCARPVSPEVLDQDEIGRIVEEHYSEKSVAMQKTWPGGGRMVKTGINHTNKILKLLGFKAWWHNNFY